MQKVKLPPKPVKLPPKPSLTESKIEQSQEAKKLSEPLKAPEAPPKAPKDLLFLEDMQRDDAFGSCAHWFKKKPEQPLLLVGPTGSGKTALIEHYCTTELDVYEQDSLCLSSAGFRGNVPVVFDNIETLDSASRAEIKSAIASKQQHRPIILTTDDIYAEPGQSLQKYCKVIRLAKPSNHFVLRVLEKRFPALADKHILKEITEFSNGNLGSAIQSCYWSAIHPDLGISKMNTEVPLDVPKATRMLLCGQHVPCIGDAPYLLQQLQLNTFGVSNLANSTIHCVSKALNNYSFLDVLEHRKIMTGEELWTCLELTAQQGPKLTGPTQSKFCFEWPKSVKKVESKFKFL